MYSIGWFSTAKGPGSRNLLTAVQKSIESGEVKARISFAFVSREPGESTETDKFIELAGSYQIPVVCYSYKRYRRAHQKASEDETGFPEWRLGYDREVMRLLADFPKPDLNMLAGYMLIVGPEMCTRYNMVNLHPAAPDGPSGTWQEVIWHLINAGASSSGVMTHLVTPELDQGPVVSYCRFPIRHAYQFDQYWRDNEGLCSDDIKAGEGEHNRLFREIRRHGAVRELPLIVSTVKAFSDGILNISDGQIYDTQGVLTTGYDLSEQIDRLVKAELDGAA
ncbi:MAG: formyltransferase family protein [Dehalogenimonas sp.]|uniref:phosphoribosylglycinamide formyltransferase 1 n=1 Tax=Candidatus Dehalogenimonas loeffleri TaxID=3127115 RepID=A0ABZ2JA29_9CHLR|nr:formyltransferase family protein [Dehalogenimonas sp.]